MNKRYLILGGLTALIVIVVVIALFDPVFANPDTFTKFLENNKRFSPLLIILIILAEVIVVPFPGSTVPIAAGFIEESLLGFVYSWIGSVLGAVVAFLIVNKFGRPFMEKFIDKKNFDFYDDFLKQKWYLLWLLYLIPLIPHDVISYAIGLSGVKFKRFILTVSIAFIPNLLFLSYFGKKIYDYELKEIFTILVPVMVLAIIIVLYINFRKKKSNF